MTDSPRSFEAERSEVCRVGRSLFERGLVHATAGNISVRLPNGDGFLITPTDACLGFLQPEQLAQTDVAGELHVCSEHHDERRLDTDLGTRAGSSGGPSSGSRADPRPSKTLALHRAIYAAAPDAGCVLHTHSTELVALTLAGVWQADAVLPPITPYFVMKVGRVPLVPYHRPGDPAAALKVSALIGDARARGAPIRAVLLERLGPNVWHGSPAAAMAVLEELEETARLWRLTGRQPAPLTDTQIEELRSNFGAVW